MLNHPKVFHTFDSLCQIENNLKNITTDRINLHFIMEELITIKTYTYPHEVYVERGKLESEGIQTFLKDEATVQVHNFYSNAVGGVKLQVFADDAKHAQEYGFDDVKLVERFAAHNIPKTHAKFFYRKNTFNKLLYHSKFGNEETDTPSKGEKLNEFELDPQSDQQHPGG